MNGAVLGDHRVGNVNGAGRALLTFCAVNGLTVMNTWYEKKDIYISTPGNIQVVRCGTVLTIF